MKLRGFPTYRCGECTLMRCYESGQTCDECRQNARVVVTVSIQLPDGKTLDCGQGYDSYAPYDWFNRAP